MIFLGLPLKTMLSSRLVLGTAQLGLPYGIANKARETSEMLSWKDVFEEQAQILFNRVNEAQLLTYLKMANLNLGFLLNWNVTLMKDGIKRLVNNLKE